MRNYISKLKIISIFLMIFSGTFCFAGISQVNAAITFGNTGKTGLWECDFNLCPDETRIGGSPSTLCGGTTGMTWYGNGVPSTQQSYYTSINSINGRTGKGIRIWKGSGEDNWTGGMNIQWPSIFDEFSIRMYMRWGAGEPLAQVDGGYNKTLYIMVGNTNYNIVDILSGMTRVTMTFPSRNIYSNSLASTQTFMADHGWHCFEYYYNFSSGTHRIWIDGVNAMDISGQITPALSWDHVAITSNNQAGFVVANGYDLSTDIDDIAIVNGSYTGWQYDAQGRKMIGLLTGGSPFDTTPPAAPTGVTVQ